VCLGDRQLADSEETFDVCDKKCFGPASLREPLIWGFDAWSISYCHRCWKKLCCI